MPLRLTQDQPLQRQIYDQIRGLIVSGGLRPGARMPSTRLLAEQHGVARITAILAYERLIAEGYLSSRPSAGTFVAGERPAPLPARPRPPRDMPRPMARLAINFTATADPDLFPLRRWRALLRERLDRMGAAHDLPPPGGSPALRGAIAEWLASTRGLLAAPEQVVVFASRCRALGMLARLLLRPGQRAVLETPADCAVEAAYVGAGARLVRVPVDLDGIATERLPPGAVALAHVTPLHQQGLGVPLAPTRRAALLGWAAASGAVIVEDDREGDVRAQPGPASLLAEADGVPVAHLGDFGAVMGPWVGLAYLVLPQGLAERARAILASLRDHAGWLEDGALATYLEGGSYSRHVHRLGRLCGQRREALRLALRREFGEATVLSAPAGMSLSWLLPPALGSARGLAEAARGQGIGGVEPVSGPGMRRELDDRVVRLGFGAMAEPQLQGGVAALAALAAPQRRVA